MANPQQPELRRSENVPSVTPDAIEGELEAQEVPEDQTPPEIPTPGPDPADEDVPDPQR